jgi:hypothetical protein
LRQPALIDIDERLHRRIDAGDVARGQEVEQQPPRDRADTVDIEVVSADRPKTIVEQNIGAGGRRVANGTYTLAELPSGGTRIAFEYAWRKAPLGERLASPLVRAVVRRGNEVAMKRLAEQLAARRAEAV